MRYGKDRDVAELMGLSLYRLQARIRAGLPMPPFILIPGAKSRVWDMGGVEVWMKKYTVSSDSRGTHSVPRDVPQKAKRARGRPRKTERSFEFS